MIIGIVGLGDMGKLYAKEFARAGFHVLGSDLPGRYSSLKGELGVPGIEVLETSAQVAAGSDLLIFSVEARYIGKAVGECASSIRPGAIVAGQTAIKTVEIEAFDRLIPQPVDIVACHSMHGPSVGTAGQILLLIRHRSSEEGYRKALQAFSSLGSRIVELRDFREHDRTTADIQAITHLCFLSMGTAWQRAGFYPWENSSYSGGIDNAKVLMALRVYAGKPHVYGELAILNPMAREQVAQYARSETELLDLMCRGKSREFRDRILAAGQAVFGKRKSCALLDPKVLGEYGLGLRPRQRRPNSNLSLLAMADAWHESGIDPYANLICRTPPYMLRVGIAEHLFRDPDLLEESLATALSDTEVRGHDLRFHEAVQDWASVVSRGDLDAYSALFEATRGFFKPRLKEAMIRSDDLIRRISSP